MKGLQQSESLDSYLGLFNFVQNILDDSFVEGKQE